MCLLFFEEPKSVVSPDNGTHNIHNGNEMLQYLDFEVALKNGYHLNEVLKETCFVFGDRKLYDDFEHGRFEVQNTDFVLHEFQRTKQLEDDLDNFSMNKLCNLLEASSCNIKRVVYRSVSLFISALGHLYSIKFSSSFNVVWQLQKEDRINGETASGLLFALAVACEVRLKVYMAKGRQDDCLDKDSSFYLKLQAISLLGCNDRVIKEWNDRHKRQLCVNDYLKSSVCFCVATAYMSSGKYQEALQIFLSFENHSVQLNRDFNVAGMILKALCLLNLGKCKEAVKHTNRAKSKMASMDFNDSSFKPALYNIVGIAKYELGLFHEALTEFRNYFKCPFDKTIPRNHMYMIQSLIYVGLCLMELGKLDSAMHKARQALELSKQIKSFFILKSYVLLSECYFRKEKYKRSLEYAEKALGGVNEIRDCSIGKHFNIEGIEAVITACKKKLGYDNTACA
ncbi:unnamed protein product [Clavelina lepadiformis]|uniref:Uncharacterized protein n=1 Tax=Clavelina lepadiformis TaxID=159417 RepID=A0ABP0G3T5_CLALP